MNLDDRMRSAHKRQLDDISNDVAGASFAPKPASPLRQVAPTVALVAVAALAILGVRTLMDSNDAVVESIDEPAADANEAVADQPGTDQAAADGGEPTASVAEAPASDEVTTTTAVPDPPDHLDKDVGEPSTETFTTTTETTIAVDAAETTDPPATDPQSDQTDVPKLQPLAAGVPSVKCPSGSRAELENATLSYVGTNQGWNRLDDLVDEQDAEFEFEAWEPGYPDPVTVEVVLADPVSAVDIRVSQDPFTPVSGDIEFLALAGDELVETFTITLDGVDGWREHTFAKPTIIDRFRITRSTEAANIMEVLVCVD